MPPRDKRPLLLTSARSHVLIDSAPAPCSSASSPPNMRRLASGCTSSSDGPRQKGAPYRRSRFPLTTVTIRLNCERRGMLSSTVLTPRNAAILKGPTNFGKNLGCSPRNDRCSDDNTPPRPHDRRAPPWLGLDVPGIYDSRAGWRPSPFSD